MHAMRLLIQSALIFFGTLMAAGLVALGEPEGAHVHVPVMPSHAGAEPFVVTAPQR